MLSINYISFCEHFVICQPFRIILTPTDFTFNFFLLITLGLPLSEFITPDPFASEIGSKSTCPNLANIPHRFHYSLIYLDIYVSITYPPPSHSVHYPFKYWHLICYFQLFVDQIISLLLKDGTKNKATCLSI